MGDKISETGMAAEQALRTSELIYRRLFEAAQDGILILEAGTGRITDVNPFLIKLLDFSKAEMLDKTVAELSPFKDVVSNEAMLAVLQREGYVRYEHLPLETRDGRHIAVEFVCNVYQAGEKKVIQCNIRDITERKKSEEKLALLSICISQINEVVLITDAEPLDEPGPRIVFANEAFERVTGYTVAEAVGQSPRFLQGQNTSRVVLAEIRQAMLHRRAIRRQVINVRKDGKEYWMDINVVPIFNKSGKCTNFVAIERDITAEKHSEEQLLWKSTLLEAQLNSSIDGILMVDGAGNRVLQNQRMAELWKIPQHISENREDAPQLAFVTGQTRNPGQFMEKVDHLYAHPEETSRDEVELLDGTILDRYSAPVRDKAGRHHGRIWNFRDITISRKLELQLRQAQKMDSIGQLAGGIAHDFNNILCAIMGNVYLAKMDVPENGDLLRHLEQIEKASRRATDLVNQILTFSRQNKQKRQPIKLNDVVLEALSLMRSSLPATVRIQTELVETPAILADTTAIHQIIMNLGTNAWHAMQNQPGVLKVELGTMEVDADFVHGHPELRPGRYVRLSMCDSGSGMDQQTKEHIFEPFFTTKGVGEGTGLGLAVVHGIVKSHDGSISVYSEPGQGTTFQMYFPVFETEPAAGQIEKPPIPRGNGEHILFVDDEEVLTKLGTNILEQLGYVVTAFTSAKEALAAYQKTPALYDLVMTDLTMPLMDGVELARQMLLIKPDQPLIITTGYTGPSTSLKLEKLGFKEILGKPSDARSLAEAVHKKLHPAFLSAN